RRFHSVQYLSWADQPGCQRRSGPETSAGPDTGTASGSRPGSYALAASPALDEESHHLRLGAIGCNQAGRGRSVSRKRQSTLPQRSPAIPSKYDFTGGDSLPAGISDRDALIAVSGSQLRQLGGQILYLPFSYLLGAKLGVRPAIDRSFCGSITLAAGRENVRFSS